MYMYIHIIHVCSTYPTHIHGICMPDIYTHTHMRRTACDTNSDTTVEALLDRLLRIILPAARGLEVDVYTTRCVRVLAHLYVHCRYVVFALRNGAAKFVLL